MSLRNIHNDSALSRNLCLLTAGLFTHFFSKAVKNRIAAILSSCFDWEDVALYRHKEQNLTKEIIKMSTASVLSPRQKVGACLRSIGLYKVALSSIRSFWGVFGVLTSRDSRAFQNYLQEYKTHKLHLGCGSNYLDGWFNTDLYPDSKRTHINATKRFPFPDNSFDFIFSEHMIEHIPYTGAYNMLSECYRVLKPGGTLRIVTPDMVFLMGLYQNREESINKRYVDWNCDTFIKESAPRHPVSVINNFYRDWGHQYIYDFDVMHDTFQKIGFKNIQRPELNKSTQKELCDLEHEKRSPKGFLKLESMVIEGQK